MPPYGFGNKVETGSMYFTRGDTGEVIKLGECENIDFEVNQDSLTRDKIDLNASVEFSGEINDVIVKDFEFELSGNLHNLTSVLLGTYTTVEVQKRKHKTKRINKKWAKKYGYYEKMITKMYDTDVIEIECLNMCGINEYAMSFENIREVE